MTNVENHFGADVAASYDADVDGMFEPAESSAQLDRLAELAADGRALEFAIGTGRVALPLAQRGVDVAGIELRRLPPGERHVVFHAGSDSWGIDEYDVATQTLISHHFRRDGDQLRHTSLPFRYVWPGELDLMAHVAGMNLSHRWAGWRREPFEHESVRHVSVWTKP